MSASFRSELSSASRLSPKDVVRGVARRLLLTLLRVRSHPFPLSAESVLVVAPHPDDETLGCGGLLLRHREARHDASIVFLTDGAASHAGHPALSPADLARLRREEAHEAARSLDVPAQKLAFLDLPDGRLSRLDSPERENTVGRLAEEIRRLRADRVLVTSRHDGSSEHQAAFHLVEDALARLSPRPRRLEYLVWAVYSPRWLWRVCLSRGRVLRVDFPGQGASKARALAAHASQFIPTPPWDRPVQPADFANAFSPETEFFLEIPPMPSTGPSVLARALRRLRFMLYGKRAGLGQPVPAEALDREYASGAWDHFFGPDELARHETLVSLIRSSHPRPRLLDLGCGSGRLASLLDPVALTAYLGVDISAEGLNRARRLALPAPLGRFEQRDFEAWTPAAGEFDVITFNECLGYAPDPLRTARRFAETLAPGGRLIVSHFRSGNHAEFWRRLARGFDFPERRVAENAKGQIWDLRVLDLRR